MTLFYVFFRLKILISEQEFSRALQKEHMVQSGTSEIESLSEEDFSNIPDRYGPYRMVYFYDVMITLQIQT